MKVQARVFVLCSGVDSFGFIWDLGGSLFHQYHSDHMMELFKVFDLTKVHIGFQELSEGAIVKHKNKVFLHHKQSETLVISLIKEF